MIALLIVGAVVAFFIVRGRRKAQLAGLDSGRPTFAVAPPGGRVGRRGREAL